VKSVAAQSHYGSNATDNKDNPCNYRIFKIGNTSRALKIIYSTFNTLCSDPPPSQRIK